MGRGRPRKPIDLALVRKLAQGGIPEEEIAYLCGVDSRTIRRRKKSDEEFRRALKEGDLEGRRDLRCRDAQAHVRRMLENAMRAKSHEISFFKGVAMSEKKFGRMCAIRSNKIIDIPITEAISKLKTVDLEIYKVAQVFFK